MSYTPSPQLLEKYAKVLINFALNSGEGLKKNEVVLIQLPEAAKPFYAPLRDAVIQAGGHPIMRYNPDDVDEAKALMMMSDEQLNFFAAPFYRGIVDACDHFVTILAEHDKYAMQGVEPKRIIQRTNAIRQYRRWRDEKELAGKCTWTIAMYGTPAMAADVNLSEEEYWQEIIAACFLDEADPIAKWRSVSAELERVRANLNSLSISQLHVQAEDVDLMVGIGSDRQWLGGSGRNIPSFELFISPDARLTEGSVSFNQPLYYYGNVIEGITLRFERGKVVESSATRNYDLLKEMLASPNADMIGEFSLTDGRMSRITKLMGETLFDENIGGPQGNTHIAVGNAYQDCYPGDAASLTKEDWQRLGYNQSAIHTDIISTSQRTVTATLTDGSQKVIYKDGCFTL